MYEPFYGLSAPPFQINPDPGFYFESKGHGSAYQYLRFGAFQGEGFIVLTGEIGAGKTTLLRALLGELDPHKIVAAQLVSTQLAADDLLSAVALAFGIGVEGLSKAKQLVALEAYLASLATANRRALLIIDEAQNLAPAAIEELRMLSNFQFGNRALLQSFLVGQPELRDILRSPRMEQLRQRVLASFHLGPMEPAETRGYIEHRLRRVGWKNRPAFDAEAFDIIHEATGGVPRRINALCNRLLLSTMLDEADRIDVERVRRVDVELHKETGGRSAVARGTFGAWSGGGPLLCVATSTQALLAAGALMHAFAAREDLPPARILRFVGDDAIADDTAARRDLEDLGVADVGVCVALDTSTRAARAAEAAAAVAACLDRQRPAALLVMGASVVEMACVAVTEAAAIPVVHIDMGQVGATQGFAPRRRRAIEQVASLRFVADVSRVEPVRAPPVSADAVHEVGSLAIDVVRLGMPHGDHLEQILRREGVTTSVLSDPAGYVVLAPSESSDEEACEFLTTLDASLRKLGWRVWLLWPLAQARVARMAERCAHTMAHSVRVVSLRGYAEWLALARHARCVISDNAWALDEATALGTPGLSMYADRAAPSGQAGRALVAAGILAREVADIIASGGRSPQLPPLSDGHAADRIAARLSDWLLARQDPNYEAFLDAGLRGAKALDDVAAAGRASSH